MVVVKYSVVTLRGDRETVVVVVELVDIATDCVEAIVSQHNGSRVGIYNKCVCVYLIHI